MKRRDMLKLMGGGVLGLWGMRAALARTVTHGRAHTPRGPVSTTDLTVLRGGETRPILEARYFTGRIGRAYRAAQEIPEVLDHLYCYCECEVSVGHKSLKSCFTDLHGANCGICQEQALMAWKLKKRGLSILEIRRKIDDRFAES